MTEESSFKGQESSIKDADNDAIEEKSPNTNTEECAWTVNRSEQHKQFIYNLYDILVCEKLPATDELIKSSTEVPFHEDIYEFIDILELLYQSYEDSRCRGVEVDDVIDNIDSSILAHKDGLRKVRENYEKLMENESILKILFHNYHPVCGIEDDEKSFLELKESDISLLKELCEIFETKVAPKILKLTLMEFRKYFEFYMNSLFCDVKSLILDSYVDLDGSYVPLKGISDQNFDHLKLRKIREIIKIGFTKTSIEQIHSFGHVTFNYVLKSSNFDDDENSHRVDRTTIDGIKKLSKHLFHLMTELRKMEIMMFVEKAENATIIKYFARKLSKCRLVPGNLESNCFIKIPVIQDWKHENIENYLIDFLNLEAFEAELFRRLFATRKMIILWNLDGKSKMLNVDFINSIEEFTKNQQILKTSFRYFFSIKNFAEKAIKLFPFTADQVEKYFHKTIETESLPEKHRHLDQSAEFEVNHNIKMFRMCLEYFTSLGCNDSHNFRCERNLLYEKALDDRFLQFVDKCQPTDRFSITEILQIASLKMIFKPEDVEFLQQVQIFDNLQLQMPAIEINRNKIDDWEFSATEKQDKMIAEYFVAQFIIFNILTKNPTAITENEAPNLIKLLSLTCGDYKYSGIKDFCIGILAIKHYYDKHPSNIFKLVRKAKLRAESSKFYNSKEMKEIIVQSKDIIDVLNNCYFWESLYKAIEKKHLENVKRQEEMNHRTKKVKNVRKVDDKPQIKGSTRLRKLNQDCEISHQFQEFLEDSDCGSDLD